MGHLFDHLIALLFVVVKSGKLVKNPLIICLS